MAAIHNTVTNHTTHTPQNRSVDRSVDPKGITRSGRISAILAIACAIHCAALPLLVSVLPLVGLGFLESHAFEIAMVGTGVAFGWYSILRAYPVHRRALPLQLLFVATLAVIAGLFFAPEAAEPFLVVGGAIMLGVAQIVNIRFMRAFHECDDCEA